MENIKKNMGIILIIVGLILTMDRTAEFSGIVAAVSYYFENYWPLLLLVLGMYLLSNPQKKRKKK